MARVIDQRYEERDGKMVLIQTLAPGTRGMNVKGRGKGVRGKSQKAAIAARGSKVERAALRGVK
jgi:hypothetical protein